MKINNKIKKELEKQRYSCQNSRVVLLGKNKNKKDVKIKKSEI